MKQLFTETEQTMQPIIEESIHSIDKLDKFTVEQVCKEMGWHFEQAKKELHLQIHGLGQRIEWKHDSLESIACWNMLEHMLDPACDTIEDLTELEERFAGVLDIACRAPEERTDSILAWRTLMALNISSPATVRSMFLPCTTGEEPHDAEEALYYTLDTARVKNVDKSELRRLAEKHDVDFAQHPTWDARRAVLFAMAHPEWSTEDVCDLVEGASRLFFHSFDECILACPDHESRMVRLFCEATQKVLMNGPDAQETQRRMNQMAKRYCCLVKSPTRRAETPKDADNTVLQARKSLLFAFSHPEHIELSAVGFLVDMYQQKFWD